jgi:hypothetical protein
MAAADKKKQIPFFRYMNFLLKFEFRTPRERNPDLPKAYGRHVNG